MARVYRLTWWRKLANWLIGALLRLGVPLGTTYLLTVPGRRSRQPRTTPVTLVEDGGRRWLVAPYGAVSWVHNARAAGQVTLSRGRHAELARVEEVGPGEAAPILRLYVRRVSITRPFFSAGPEAPIEEFVAEAARHPVFRIVGPPADVGILDHR